MHRIRCLFPDVKEDIRHEYSPFKPDTEYIEYFHMTLGSIIFKLDLVIMLKSGNLHT